MYWNRYRDPGPEFVSDHVLEDEHHQVMSTLRDFELATVPVATGAIAVATPYIVGASLVYFGPTPYHKTLGASMMIPGPQDLVYFAAGYYVGEQWVQSHSIFGDEWV